MTNEYKSFLSMSKFATNKSRFALFSDVTSFILSTKTEEEVLAEVEVEMVDVAGVEAEMVDEAEVRYHTCAFALFPR